MCLSSSTLNAKSSPVFVNVSGDLLSSKGCIN